LYGYLLIKINHYYPRLDGNMFLDLSINKNLETV